MFTVTLVTRDLVVIRGLYLFLKSSIGKLQKLNGTLLSLLQVRANKVFDVSVGITFRNNENSSQVSSATSVTRLLIAWVVIMRPDT
jgi:hypothetical protein